ncbi:Histone-lysine N-methyltransferase ASHR1 [Diplonema papillatum]|nr:Histone-lysine N-methyltransferase ASHR1 [Diplonema papillatum]
MTSAYEVTQVIERGRCLTASRQIPATSEAQPILEEDPLAHSVTREDVCDGCLKPFEKLQVCTQCKFASYCGTACQASAWKSHHKRECKLFAELGSRNIKPTPTLVLTHRLLVSCKGNPDHENLTELCHHEPSLRQETRDMYLQLGVLLNGMLKATGYQELTSRQVMILFARLQANSFSVLDPELQTCAYAVYRTASTVNHSCSPNAIAAFSGKRLAIVPLREVAQGAEITISYVELASTGESRRAELLSQYNFTCRCPRCEQWGAELEQAYPPAVLAEGQTAISTLIAQQDYGEALAKAVAFLPYLNLYAAEKPAPPRKGVAPLPAHPSAGMHYFNIAKLRWHLDMIPGAFEAADAAASILRKTQLKDSELLRSVVEFRNQTYQAKCESGA